MSDVSQSASMIIRTERGLTIAGTRTTIYSIMDYLKANWPAPLIQAWLVLTEAQLTAALDYIASYPDEVESEYQHVVAQAHAVRVYWEERNRERFALVANRPITPGTEALFTKLQARKAELGLR
jgi:uncharacterized protein (DUF433 family)